MVMMKNPKKDITTNRSTYKLNKQIFILAGQSNMAGQGGVCCGHWDGIVPPECQSNPDILKLSVSLRWEIAKEPLNYGVDCARNCGIGPGMAFANAILKKDPNFGVIGLVPCSVSGKGINWWSRGNIPYDRLLEKVRSSLRQGGELRGLLWFHGESDTITKFDATRYKPKLQKFIQDLRTDLNSPLLPLLMVVLHIPDPWFKGKFADIVRQAQIEVEIPNAVKVDANGLSLNPDGIHLTTASQIRVGNMLAEAFLCSNFTSPRKISNKVYHMMSST
ncbi:probable carbohydrate esterase At4g34215 [Lycium ferocissimum]|uniref:probable carbohydrate esterase At4g34215 n=1 Tax=Lycium ferocissimum TaxID=112874 RepID=UPI002815BEF0|nr:probable carbohydrate esterase At4g34215 [Lycium ferocissimum]